MQEQLDENKQRARIRKREGAYLLQGLVVCKRCRCAYCGAMSKNGERINYYYRCSTKMKLSSNMRGICDNKPVRTTELEIAIWEKVKDMLNEPERLIDEYEHRLSGKEEISLNEGLEREESKLKRGISRLIDSYVNEYINQGEFESRITEMRKRLKEVEEEKEKVKDQEMVEQEFAIIVSSIKKFASDIKLEIDQYSWSKKRSAIRKLVKRIEINVDDIIVVFRIKEFIAQNRKNQSMRYCSRVQTSRGRARETYPVKTLQPLQSTLPFLLLRVFLSYCRLADLSLLQARYP